MATARYVAPDIPGFDAQAYLTANPDIASGWGQQSQVSGFAQKFPTATDYAAWHYQNFGAGEIAAGTRAPLGAQGNGPPTTTQAQDQTNSLTTNLTNTGNDAVNAVKTTGNNAATSITTAGNDVAKTATGAATDTATLLNNQTTAFTNLVNQFSTDFTNQQTSLLQSMQQAASDQVTAIQKAMKAAQDQIGQAQKKPNYAQALAKNRELNGSGLSSTMLTGATGVASSALPLMSTSLLGKARHDAQGLLRRPRPLQPRPAGGPWPEHPARHARQAGGDPPWLRVIAPNQDREPRHPRGAAGLRLEALAGAEDRARLVGRHAKDWPAAPAAGLALHHQRDQPGRAKHNKIYDNTGLRAVRILAAGMMSGLTSPARPWFKLKPTPTKR
jgi:hypothetical protein